MWLNCSLHCGYECLQFCSPFSVRVLDLAQDTDLDGKLYRREQLLGLIRERDQDTYAEHIKGII